MRLIGFLLCVSIPFRAVTGFELPGQPEQDVAPPWFQSLSGLSLGLNRRAFNLVGLVRGEFQSLSGLSLGLNRVSTLNWLYVGIAFQSLSGLSLGLNVWSNILVAGVLLVSIPFRAVTGFEPRSEAATQMPAKMFQSLSGLSLGLNQTMIKVFGMGILRFNPFQGCHWV